MNEKQKANRRLANVYTLHARSAPGFRTESKPPFGGSTNVFRAVTMLLTQAENVEPDTAQKMAGNAAVLFRSMEQVIDYLRRHRDPDSAKPLHDLLAPLEIPQNWQDPKKSYRTPYDEQARGRNEQLRPWTEAIIQQGPRMAVAFTKAAHHKPVRNGHNYSIVESAGGPPRRPKSGPGSYGRKQTAEPAAPVFKQPLIEA